MEMEIHITPDGLCKVIQGKSRRVFYSTEEAIGLALLKINPAQVGPTVNWIDFLDSKGLAIGAVGDKALTLLTVPAKERTLPWRRGTISRELKVTMPPLLIATRFIKGRLNKAQIWLIRPGFEEKLSTASSDPCLSPFPYGNVYNTGIICWGTTVIRDISHPNEVEGVFFHSGFNGDLWSGGALGITETTLPDLVTRVEGKLPVPATSAFTKSVSAVAQDITR